MLSISSLRKDGTMAIVTCYDCCIEYGGPGWIEAIIPNKVWEKISPSENMGGILCVNCISRRLAEKGYENVPMWFCGTEPIEIYPGPPGLMLKVLLNWEPDKEIDNQPIQDTIPTE